MRLLARDGNAKALAALGPALLENLAAIGSLHARAEAMAATSLGPARLHRSLHMETPGKLIILSHRELTEGPFIVKEKGPC